jgi:hypothetical protein
MTGKFIVATTAPVKMVRAVMMDPKRILGLGSRSFAMWILRELLVFMCFWLVIAVLLSAGI